MGERPLEADPDGSATATDVEHGAPGQPPGGRGRGRSAYSNRDLTTGSISRNLWFLAWPQTVNSSLRVVGQLADLVWAGFVGSLAIAGLGVAFYSGTVSGKLACQSGVCYLSGLLQRPGLSKAI